MNSSDELERMLGQQLHDRAGDMVGAPIGLGDVKGRAGRIRRNRRIAGGVAVAAVLAVAVPTAIAVNPGPGGSDSLPPATQPPSGPVETTLTLDGLPAGDTPGIEYFTEDGVVLPGAGLQPLDQSYQAMVEITADGTWWAVSPSRDDVVYLDGDFREQTSAAITQRLVSNPDRSAVAFVAPESGAQTLLLRSTTDVEGGQAWDLPELPVAQPVDFAGEATLVYQTTDQQGRTEIGLALPDGTTESFGGDYLKAVSASPASGLVAVQTARNDDGSGCFGVVDATGDRATPEWETCDFALGAFSPDGRYLLASDPYQSGLGWTSVSILDAQDGALVASFRQERGGRLALPQLAWESADAVVATAVEGQEGAVLRLGVDGSLEQAVETAPLVGDVPFYLGEDRVR